jgi:CheY-like chemotaxis protein
MRLLRILVAEDDPSIGILLAEMLQELGHSVCAVAISEDDAVAAAVRYSPDMMIVDARLRDGSGIAAVGAIRRTGHVPYVFISGDAAAVRALRPEAIVLQKPFRESDLVRAIHHALAGVGAAHLAGPTGW